MTIDPEIAQARPEILLASVLHLLSCSAAHGMTYAKSQSIVQHLSALVERDDTDALLARACEELADVWLRLSDELLSQRAQELLAHTGAVSSVVH